jgi:hypothetical protein
MTPIETLLIAGPVVTGIAAFGLEWYQRQSKSFRMRRSLRGYAGKALAEESATEQEAFALWSLKAA